MGRALLTLSAAEKLGLALLLAVAAVGCKPSIGDKCSVSTDCSQTGDRLCDISAPDGYCTIYNCEPKGSNASSACPDEASCIAFGADPSSVPGCQNALGSTPYQRTFCMKKCDNNNNCRGGYVCEDPQADPRFGAVDVDGPGKVCMVAFSAAEPDGENGVCTETSPAPGTGEMPPEISGVGGASEAGGGADTGTAGANASGLGGNDGT
jgi:hypothetical protein